MYSGQLASTGTQGWGCARAMTSSQSRSRPGVSAATSTFRRWKMMQCSGLEADAAIASLTMSLYLDKLVECLNRSIIIQKVGTEHNELARYTKSRFFRHPHKFEIELSPGSRCDWTHLTILCGSTPQLAAMMTRGSACSILVHSSRAAKPAGGERVQLGREAKGSAWARPGLGGVVQASCKTLTSEHNGVDGAEADSG